MMHLQENYLPGISRYIQALYRSLRALSYAGAAYVLERIVTTASWDRAIVSDRS